MKANKESHMYKIVLRFLAPYICILLLFLVVGMVIYNKTVSMVKEEMIKTNMTLLEQSKEILDRRFDEVESSVQRIISNPKVASFEYLREPFEGANVYRILETKRELYAHELSQKFILGYFLLFKEGGIAFNDNETYKLPEFYRYVLQYEGEDYESWYHQFLEQYHRGYLPAKSTVFEGTRYSLVTYIQSMGLPGYFHGAAVALLDNKEIQKLLSGLDTSDGGWAYIADKQGRIISSVSRSPGDIQPMNIDFKNSQGVIGPSESPNGMMITYTVSQFNGWSYVAVQPSHIVLQKVYYMKKMILSILLVALLLGVVLACVMAYRNSKPVRSLVRTITEHFEGALRQSGDAYGFIQDTLSSLIVNNEELQGKLHQQLPFLRAAFFERLLKGGFKSQREIEVLQRHIGVHISNHYYTVALLKLRGSHEDISGDMLEELNIKRIVVKEILGPALNDKGHPHDVEADKIAWLLTSNGDLPEERNQEFHRLIQQIDDIFYHHFNVRPTIAVGGIYANLLSVSRSYEEAERAMNFNIWDNSGEVIWYSALAKGNNNYYYPGDAELRLTFFAKSGDKEESAKLLSELYNENFVVRKLLLYMLRLFLYEMCGTIVKLLEQIAIEDEEAFEFVKSMAQNLDTYEDMERNYDELRNTYFRICTIVHQRKKSSNTQLINSILEYLEEGFVKTDLSLVMVSDKFHVSEAYLSRFFKEQTGYNFFDYLEKMRMDQAEKLLENTGMPICDIVQMIGYNSSNTFGRAFKRIHGISATAFRDAAQR